MRGYFLCVQLHCTADVHLLNDAHISAFQTEDPTPQLGQLAKTMLDSCFAQQDGLDTFQD